MKSFPKFLIAALMIMSAVGCTRIETGEVGLRTNWDKTTDMTERLPGSLNQVITGSITTYKVKDVSVEVNDIRAIDLQSASLKDLDFTAIYSINPSSVAEIWTSKSKSFHGADDEGDIYLMSNYVSLLVKNAATKAVRKYPSLKMLDNQTAIEADVLESVNDILKKEKLDTAITISQIQARVIMLADVVVVSANELVRSENELARKIVDVKTASKEAERIAILNANSGAIGYMNAMSMSRIADGIANGKVSTIVVPVDFKGMINVTPSTK